jgi:hypothetical protein
MIRVSRTLPPVTLNIQRMAEAVTRPGARSVVGLIQTQHLG